MLDDWRASVGWRAIRPDAPLLPFPPPAAIRYPYLRAQSMRLEVRVMSLSLEMTCTTPPHSGQAVPVNPREQALRSSKSSSAEIRLVHRLAHVDRTLVVTTPTKLSVGAIAPMRSMPVMKVPSASKPATTGSA